MINNEEFSEEKSQLNKPNFAPGSPLADIISLETVVNVLVQKGLCTPEELFEMEQKRHQYQKQVQNISPVQISNHLNTGNNQKTHNHNSWLKRKMSKNHWSRRLGTILFGWQWKKVKTNLKIKNSENGQL